jgi:gluconate 2-dehydrogenase gamma chain
MKRRDFMMVPVKALGGLALSAVLGDLVSLNAINASNDTVKVPLRFFTASEAKTIQAAAERIFPNDESGPGATEAAVVIYIDRQLAGPYGKDKYRYTKGPWIASSLEHGYQEKENPQQIYRAGLLLLGEDFAAVSAAEQDQRLEKIEMSRFFQLLRTHTIEGMFCDPLHGGNVNMVGWKLIGFPGPRMSYRSEIDKYYGKAYTAEPKSLEQILRHPVKAVEDEESS